MKERVWKIETRRLSDLKLLENNPRTISEEDYKQLKKDLKLGKFKPFVIDNDNAVLAGNQTLRVLRETEKPSSEWDCSVPQFKLTEKERKKIILLDNRHRGEDDMDILANEFQNELEELGYFDLPIDEDEEEKREDSDEEVAGYKLEISCKVQSEIEDLKTEIDHIILQGKYKDVTIKVVKLHQNE